jgi:hypothetical protein
LCARDFGVADDCTEHVVEVVRHRSGKEADGLSLLAVPQTSLESPALFFQSIASSQYVAQYQEQDSRQPGESQRARAARKFLMPPRTEYARHRLRQLDDQRITLRSAEHAQLGTGAGWRIAAYDFRPSHARSHGAADCLVSRRFCTRRVAREHDAVVAQQPDRGIDADRRVETSQVLERDAHQHDARECTIRPADRAAE